MKFDIDKKSAIAIAAIIATGIVLAVAIVFWKGDGAHAEEHGEHAEHAEAGAAKGGAHDKHEDAHEDAHEDEHEKVGTAAPGQIAMSAQQIRTAGIATATAAPASIRTEIVLPGEVRFNGDRTAHVVPRVAGVVESVPAALGQVVRKGQPLAVIASAELAELRSAAQAAERRRELAELTYTREKSLWEQKISAQQDYLQAQQAWREAQIEARSARSKLTALGADASSGALNRFVLRAPFDGAVVEKHLAQGEAVKEDANVFLISDLSTVWVEIVVTAKDIESIRVGQPVTIRSASGSASVTGKVSYVGNLLGEQTRTATARVVIDNPGMAWRPGLFVNVALVRGQSEAAIAVPAGAVQSVDGKSVVFTRTATGFQAQPVTTGASDGTLVEIKEGLAPGATYVTTGSFVVKAEQGKGSAEHAH